MGVEDGVRGGPTPHIGLFTSITMVVGTIVGVGIFGNPQSAYIELGSIGLTFSMWIAGGLLTIAGAFCYAELGCAMPANGGEHIYLMNAFGPYVAYSFDWTQSLLSWPLSCSAVATIASQYIAKLILMDTSLTPDEQPAPPEWVLKLISVVLILVLTAVNCVSVTFGAKVQRILTVIKFGALAFVAVIGFVYLAKGETTNFREPFVGSSTSVSSLGAGLTSILFSYGGFNNLSLMLGEMKNVERKLPIALIISLMLVVVIYVVANVTYFAVLPLSTIRATKVIGLNVGHVALGTPGSIILSVLIAICALGTINALIFGNARLIAAFAKDGMIFPRFLSRTHATRGAPIYAIFLTAIVSIALIFAGNLDFLVGMYAFSSYFFFFWTVVGLIVMRFTRPQMHRPFRVWIPVAVLFCLVSVFVVVFPFIEAKSFDDVLPYVIAVAFILVPVPIVAFNLRRTKRNRDLTMLNLGAEDDEKAPEVVKQ
ncbi:amino acid/polyamine transporter I [Powellomyces hirtus]|nr:amino acid/polyamine transporter I [Powellomyces hirtus]